MASKDSHFNSAYEKRSSIVDSRNSGRRPENSAMEQKSSERLLRDKNMNKDLSFTSMGNSIKQIN